MTLWLPISWWYCRPSLPLLVFTGCAGGCSMLRLHGPINLERADELASLRNPFCDRINCSLYGLALSIFAWLHGCRLLLFWRRSTRNRSWVYRALSLELLG